MRRRYQGLYDPQYDRDACGVGVVANLNGQKTHDIVRNAIRVLINLEHRGACGCDPETGDGAGILLQMPHEFFTRQCEFEGIHLPPPGDYGVGMVFLPQEAGQHRECERLISQVVRDEGQRFLGWRDVPVDHAQIGRVAREVAPIIRQFFVGRGESLRDPAPVERELFVVRSDRRVVDWQREAAKAQFERKLYVIRKVIESRVRAQQFEDGGDFYIPSLSSKTIVYKGLLMAGQLDAFYRDLSDESVVTALALVHSRYSTNTLGSWKLAHPYRMLCHNGEINTLRGNMNWMRAREALFSSPLFGDDMKKLLPIMIEGSSDTACIDNTLELLVATGRSLPHAIMMLIPEAWENHESMPEEKKAFYEYHSCLIEPWDGPALIAACDGERICTSLDRNGLRPFRYVVTDYGFVVGASETGVLDDIPADRILKKGRLQPGRLFLIDTTEGRIIEDEEIKHTICTRRPYGRWLAEQKGTLDDLPVPEDVPGLGLDTLEERQRAFGYTSEELKILLTPMARDGEEPVGSMGNDAPLAVLSNRPQLLFHYFKQLFAQVTNPPLDAIREELVTSLESFIGSEQDIFDETPLHCRQLRLKYPILSNAQLARVRQLDRPGLRAATLSTLFQKAEPDGALEQAVEALCQQAAEAVRSGATILILSDRGVNEEMISIPSLLAAAAVHHHLIREGLRTKTGLVVESGEPREVMHCCLLIGYGAGAVNPYLTLETVEHLRREGFIPGNLSAEQVEKHLLKALNKGILKTMSKMGISTIQSYRGAQIFEAIGINKRVIDRYFTWTASRIEGIGLVEIEQEARMRHLHAYPDVQVPANLVLDVGGYYQWRRGGEFHLFNPDTISKLQVACRTGDYKVYKEYAALIDTQQKQLATLRGLFEFKPAQSPVPLEEVEPASDIVKRFATGAMSFGSISKEAHENLAIAMNRIGGKSNSGEGGEDPARYYPAPDGTWRNSAIKQVASARFGVNSNYLVNASDLQIKMAQGAKPGEGGQLPGHKVFEHIARVRKSTPGVGLISPPPHHDIYSIEDLAQLIHDLKNANSRARIHVKLVAEVGVGTVAAGVSKGKADVVLISGYDGGTGASPESSMKHAGIPWELGLSETQQVLVQNDLRGRIVVQTDGQLKTGRDVAIACLLGAEEFGFATTSLVASGCIMLRKCHLNTCSVGIATQDEELRKQFTGKPEHVINFMFFIAEHLREIMSQLGFRTINEMVGRVDCLDTRTAIEHWKAKGLDFTKLLTKPDAPPHVATYCREQQDHRLQYALDNHLIELSKEALEHKQPVVIHHAIQNINRTVGTMLSSEVSRRYGEAGLPNDTIQVFLHGSAGQSFGAFLAPGISLSLEGDSNDYTGKGLSGGRMAIFPSRNAKFKAEDNIIIGNVALYGATAGKAFFCGRGGERFAVRNSGVEAVIEGLGDHGCEYMTRGCVVVLGSVGRNFAAGMSGGIAYVLDEAGVFPTLCNHQMVDLEPVDTDEDIQKLRGLIEEHVRYTQSQRGQYVLDHWSDLLPKFVKIMPVDYRRAMMELAAKAQQGVNGTNGHPQETAPAAQEAAM
ncbi:MAG: glutamate synthase large subunit [Candidatus Latescibacteria bacterium]|nr:glutamate synthase large subunit [Candidatus Latescibacterota bacterium]